jgi:hypothetical protein
MQFDENLRGDTPMGLLRGIKHGTESYHVLFKRLCRSVSAVCFIMNAAVSVMASFICPEFSGNWLLLCTHPQSFYRITFGWPAGLLFTPQEWLIHEVTLGLLFGFQSIFLTCGFTGA